MPETIRAPIIVSSIRTASFAIFFISLLSRVGQAVWQQCLRLLRRSPEPSLFPGVSQGVCLESRTLPTPPFTEAKEVDDHKCSGYPASAVSWKFRFQGPSQADDNCSPEKALQHYLGVVHLSPLFDSAQPMSQRVAAQTGPNQEFDFMYPLVNSARYKPVCYQT